MTPPGIPVKEFTDLLVEADQLIRLNPSTARLLAINERLMSVGYYITRRDGELVLATIASVKKL